MSIHSDLMLHATEVLVMVQGDSGADSPATYQSPGKQAFIWEGTTLGVKKGEWLPADNQDLLKVTSLIVQGPSAVLIANGVTEIESEAVVTIGGLDWSIDQNGSTFGPSLTRLNVFRRPIASHYQAQSDKQR